MRDAPNSIDPDTHIERNKNRKKNATVTTREIEKKATKRTTTANSTLRSAHRAK